MSDGRDIGDIEAKIRNRNSWLRVFVVVVAVGLLVWKVIDTPLNVDLTRFDFSDLLALILALFAIALSIAFYLKATDTSNAFYDNTYRFTMDVSEILGRIESGFGERLRHLDVSYTGLIDRLPSTAAEHFKPEEVKRDIADGQRKLDEAEQARNDLLNRLAERAEMQEAEKGRFLADLQDKERQLEQSRNEMAALRRRLADAEDMLAWNDEAGQQDDGLFGHLYTVLLRTLGISGIEALESGHGSELARRLRPALSRLSSAELDQLRRYGLVTADLAPTPVLLDRLRTTAKLLR